MATTLSDLSGREFDRLSHHPPAFFRPKPSPSRLVRIGGARDGAYLVPDDFGGVTACFSPGVANRKSFEDDLARRLGLRSHLLDFSSDVSAFETPLSVELQTFEKKWLAQADGPDSLSLETWINQREPKASELMLQMDIEGAEYPILAAVSPHVLRRFRILIIEFHAFRERLVHLGDDQEFNAVVDKLDEGFIVVHARANNCCPSAPVPGEATPIPQVVELTLLRRDRFEGSGRGRLHRVMLPHPADIGRNVREEPPLHLGGSWLESPRPLLAWSKVLVDWFAWFVEVRVQRSLFRVWQRTSFWTGNMSSRPVAGRSAQRRRRK